jgi:hypothetical protein
VTRISACVLMAVGIASIGAAQEIHANIEPAARPEQGCTFRADPSQFLKAQARARQSIQERVKKLRAARYSEADGLAEGAAIVRRNFIDEEIFEKLQQAKVAPARLSSDEEFVRRIFLDLIGRIPSAAQVNEFVQSTASDKRDRLIDSLLGAPEFNDKWAVWFEDLVGMTEILSTSNRRPRIEGRNSFDRWIREQMQNNRSMTDIVKATLTATGNNYYTENGPASFVVLGSAAMGPVQDTYDLQLVKSVNSYLGVGHYDCLLCHSGRGHLDQISVWAARTTRSDAERMAAHFARTRLTAVPNTPQYQSPLFQSTDVQDVATGTYDLNTNSGNRPARAPFGTERSLTPEYRDGTKASGNWRAAFANKLTSDPLFGVNFANRLWKEFFGLALIDPVDSIDPDRLDAGNPPPSPWSLQPTHPALLQKLARLFMENDTNLRFLIRTMVQSSAYQLSSRYEGEWKADYVPLFARHYPRRLWAEEVHDAIVRATEVLPRYTWPKISADTVTRGTAASALPQSDPVSWAMQLPDTNEPRLTPAVRDFMASFTRGNRDTARRSSAGSILQELNLMNDNTMVLSKIRMANSPRLKDLARIADSGQLVDELWLTFLSRRPTESERAKAVGRLSKSTTAATRNTAIEDLAWVAINKVDFLFSY